MHTPILCSLAACALAGSAAAGQLVAVDSNRTIYDIDMTTGVKTAIGTVSTNVSTPSGLARDPATGTIWGVSTTNDALYTLDIATGNATLVGTMNPTSVVMHGLEWDSSTGTLYGGSNGDLFTIDTTTAAVTMVGDSGLSSFLNLVHVPTTNTLYATNSGTDSFYSVDRTTGFMTLIGPLAANVANPNGLAWDGDHGVVWMIDNNTDSLYTIDVTTGTATLVGLHVGSSNLLGLVYLPDASSATSYCHGDGSGTACPCGNAGTAGNGCANSLNANGANLAAGGSASISADTLVLTGSGMPNSSALYFQGSAQVNGGSGAVFGDGLRCVGGTVTRLGTKLNAAGTSQYPGVGDASISVRGMNAAGNVRDYQCWYRNADPAFCTPSTFNLTNAVELTWQP